MLDRRIARPEVDVAGVGVGQGLDLPALNAALFGAGGLGLARPGAGPAVGADQQRAEGEKRKEKESRRFTNEPSSTLALWPECG